jgi:hypothetical protein
MWAKCGQLDSCKTKILFNLVSFHKPFSSKAILKV